ncbi:MAG: Peptidyl-tRNA hydrolase [Microgenomates group bacterium GW2011_GWC1_41_8]|uniref:Peptidyl-tRNA hydrolase n=3 Tax=Candidatus Roizmaniibacteriota TaxID=1752723 RepID=A0A0G1A789_9BACT|nr:MAG: Peptidyl-tRNA hydrolase [Candidatus Roizmanbacteria bacterium GW2011_GWB1_40_7]KKR94190.1 MAG: Peptidyl-tRNA hydrolase [Candidatus Roizmanbacteria bacterium GW2011_GWA1_41_13]KKS21153.1 MAG: Peptidyl-tRNA hydrolase [Candidatus Roizmanbacteria bacterium GW2011_GWC2_41_7]KKS23945.1 MAG: Peptidyl-tRNA hydrolase [Microgenomates group bacterium GW2011_GWC1_41_8]OGK49692.1 MAG: aminoacyl-tRNA hydrolase [Candidatus Roizmanbacteria bacterium RIFCSPLOWO2_01_FULL_40_14]
MFLIVGLGNPGEEYKNTRHNVGFDVIEKITNYELRITSETQNTNLHFDKMVNSEIAKIRISSQEVILAKPQSFMNNSGLVVKKLLNSNQQLTISNLVIVHDDISMDLGQVKISKGAGAGNHNGVVSIINHLKTKDFIRIRCGIGRGDGVLSDVVLSKFRPDEKEVVAEMVKKASEACVMIVKEGLEKAMNQVN